MELLWLFVTARKTIESCHDCTLLFGWTVLLCSNEQQRNYEEKIHDSLIQLFSQSILLISAGCGDSCIMPQVSFG